MVSRRWLLKATGAGALAAVAASGARLVEARGLLVEKTLDETVQRALETAKRLGATYADIRIHRRRSEAVATREDHVTAVSARESYGLGVRVIAGGAWGFAASARVEPAEAARVATLAVEVARGNARAVRRPVTLAPTPPAVDVWQTAMTKDPFKIPVADKADLLLAVNAAVLKTPGVPYVSSSIQTGGEWKLLATSDGAYVEQDITRINPSVEATAVDARTGKFESVAHPLPALQAGWEHVGESTLLADAPKLAASAVEKLRAASVEPGPRDLILAPSNLWLTIHESVGHPTELDRVLGQEANFAGTSFATIDKLRKLKYGTPIVTLYADRTTPGGLATCGYDDDGVRTGRWDIVKDGILVGYQTTREQAAWIGEKASRATSYAQDHKSFPFQRMPNLSLAPAPRERSLADLVAATDDAILIHGDGSWSIDHQRYNFQFSGQTFHEVKKGKITRPLKDVAYQANSIDFWNACDLIGGPASWELHGAMHDGKGEPIQSNAVSHGCPPARFRKINILNTRGQGGKGHAD